MAETTTPVSTPPSETPVTTTPPPVETATPAITPQPVATPPPTEAAPKVPDKYELKLSDKSPLDNDALTRIAGLAKEKGLSQDQAQLLVQAEESSLTNFQTKQAEAYNQTKAQWAEAVQKDKEIGGENFKQSVALSSRVVDRFATEEFKKTLDVTGLGQHPEIVRVFARIGKAMSNDQLIMPGAQGAGKKEMKDILYGPTNAE
jgi:hypothetical protein